MTFIICEKSLKLQVKDESSPVRQPIIICPVRRTFVTSGNLLAMLHIHKSSSTTANPASLLVCNAFDMIVINGSTNSVTSTNDFVLFSFEITTEDLTNILLEKVFPRRLALTATRLKDQTTENFQLFAISGVQLNVFFCCFEGSALRCTRRLSRSRDLAYADVKCAWNLRSSLVGTWLASR